MASIIFLKDTYSRTSQEFSNFAKITSKMIKGDSGKVNISNEESSDGELQISYDYIFKKPFRT